MWFWGSGDDGQQAVQDGSAAGPQTVVFVLVGQPDPQIADQLRGIQGQIPGDLHVIGVDGRRDRHGVGRQLGHVVQGCPGTAVGQPVGHVPQRP